MGLVTKGPLSVQVYKLHTERTLDEIAEVINSRTYPSEEGEPSDGWGSIADDHIFVDKYAVRLTYKGYKPQPQLNHNGIRSLNARYYYDYVNVSLRRRFPDPSLPWTAYYERGAFDVLIMDEGEPEELTALVSTRKREEIRDYVDAALASLVSGTLPPSTVDQASLTEELDSDFFKWLMYKNEHGNVIAEQTVIAEMNAVNADRSGKRSSLTNGASMDREDIIALVARNRAVFGPAKIGVTHNAEPRGYFELELYRDGGFSITRKNSSYRDSDLLELSTAELGLRMIEDIWQIILPKIRDYHRTDVDWRSTDRDEFIVECKAELRVIADS